jgi:hypothetical protein
VVIFTPQPIYPRGNCPWYPFDRRPGGPQRRSGCCVVQIMTVSQSVSLGVEPQIVLLFDSYGLVFVGRPL